MYKIFDSKAFQKNSQVGIKDTDKTDFNLYIAVKNLQVHRRTFSSHQTIQKFRKYIFPYPPYIIFFYVITF